MFVSHRPTDLYNAIQHATSSASERTRSQKKPHKIYFRKLDVE